MNTKGANPAHSTRERLSNYSKSQRLNFDLVLLRYANERLLYRLGQSEFAERFLLKGATLFLLWNENQPHRPTRDVDLLAMRSEDADELRRMFQALCGMNDADGMVFDAASVKVAPIREEQRYGGQRITLRGHLHGARVPVQVDIGFGDAVTPPPDWVDLPVVLEGMEKPRLKAYPIYTVVAEKFEAMVQLGLANSRMKDFYDLDFLLSRFALEPETLKQAVRNTFTRRQTPLPGRDAVLFSPEFVTAKAPLWEQFLQRNRLVMGELTWAEILGRLERQLRNLLD